MTIKYKENIKSHNSKTRCPHKLPVSKYGSVIRVGSLACQSCKYWRGQNLGKREIRCIKGEEA
jgi:hypothetical protein